MENEVERYADNGQYSHSEIINSETGEFICFVCPICAARFEASENEKYDSHKCM